MRLRHHLRVLTETGRPDGRPLPLAIAPQLAILRQLAILLFGAMILVAPPLVAQGFDPQAATDQMLARVPAEARARSDAYFEGGYWIRFWSTLITAGLMIALL